MTKKAAFWIFLLGTLSSAALFLGLTWDMHRQVDVLSRADKLSDTVVAGKNHLKNIIATIATRFSVSADTMRRT